MTRTSNVEREAGIAAVERELVAAVERELGSWEADAALEQTRDNLACVLRVLSEHSKAACTVREEKKRESESEKEKAS